MFQLDDTNNPNPTSDICLRRPSGSVCGGLLAALGV